MLGSPVESLSGIIKIYGKIMFNKWLDKLNRHDYPFIDLFYYLIVIVVFFLLVIISSIFFD